jgi:hypothetical protein
MYACKIGSLQARQKKSRHCLYIPQNANVLSEGTHPKIFIKYLGKGRAEITTNICLNNSLQAETCRLFPITYNR